MKPPYDIRFLTFIQVVQKRDNVYYFNNINVISIMMIVQRKVVN
jgi:hypothetical protein